MNQLQCSCYAAVVAGGQESTMRIVIAGDIRDDATIPADIIACWSKVLFHCHFQTAASIIYWEVKLHHSLPKGLLTDHDCPAYEVRVTETGSD